MKFTQLKYFCEVCRMNNISKAAENLFVSQSAISLSIKELEAEFETKLFIRNNNRLTLTETGQRLLSCAQRVMEEVDATYKTMCCTGCCSQVIKVGLAQSCIDYVVPLLDVVINKVKERRPNLEVQICEINGREMERMVLEKELDIAMVTYSHGWPDRVGAKKLFSSVLKVCVSRCHPLAGEEIVHWSQLDREPLILSVPMKRVISEWVEEPDFKKKNISLDFRYVFSQQNTLEHLVERNYGIGMSAPGLFVPDSDQILLLPIEEPLRFELGVFWNKDITLKDEAAQLLEMICNKKFIHKVKEQNLRYAPM